ncbi:MAG: dihydrofolate synthase [Micromonosporaceae bacterium]|nr:dihydrofolate synthase [Micromonosporaceae bacterium]
MSRANSEHQKVLDELHTRWPDAQVVPTLERVQQVVTLMGEPQQAYPVIQVAGTNGKSSTTRMAAELLRAAGLRVGRFTSPEPQLGDRIAVDGSPVGPERFVELYHEVAPYVAVVEAELSQRLTIFEVMTPMAFAAFADAPVDAAVVEVGLGGAWDATNVVRADVAVLTPIGLDHQKYLGDTIEEIATEKAGIIKPGATVVLARQPAEAARPILERCVEVGATVAREDAEFGVLRRSVAVGGQLLTLQGLGAAYDEVFVPAHGPHQAQNAALALAAVEALLGAGTERQLDPELVREGFAAIRVPGRLERVRSAPTVLLDAAHNPPGMAATAAALTADFAFRKLVAVVSIAADKDAGGMLELLEPAVAEVVVTRNSSARAMPVDRLAGLATERFGEDRVHVAAELPDAIELAVTLAEADLDGPPSGVGVLITGSVVTVDDARRLLAPGGPREGLGGVRETATG